MSFSYLLFLVYDLFCRKQLTKTIKQLEYFYHSGTKPSDTTLLRYAVKHVPFYQSEHSNALTLEDFPVVNKELIKCRQKDFISNECKIEKLIQRKTSGSNGVPFFFYWDKKKALSRTAEIIYHNGWIGYQVGDRHLLNAVGLSKTALTLYFQKEIITNPRTISEKWLALQKKMLIENKIPFYIGFGSVIDRFTKYCAASGDHNKMFFLKGIISTAEHLSERSRAQTESQFGCPVLRRYATLETGVLAHECLEGRKYHVNSGCYRIEFLKLGSDKPAEPGELARIVVTDLNAYAMPLIRYDIGDLAIIDHEPCFCGRKGVVIKELVGRRTDNLIGENGQIVSWISISDIMWSFPNIERFQVIQINRREFAVNVVSQDNYDTQKLIRAFNTLLGDSIHVQLNNVDFIAPPESGKIPYIINKMLPATTSDA